MNGGTKEKLAQAKRYPSKFTFEQVAKDQKHDSKLDIEDLRHQNSFLEKERTKL